MAITIRKEEARGRERGFALLVSVIFTSVMLALGLILSSLAYKQTILASSAIQSQYAFYAADAALECLLVADQQNGLFEYDIFDPGSPPLLTCDGTTAQTNPAVPTLPVPCKNGTNGCPANEAHVTERISLDGNKRCADVTVYKYKNGFVTPGGTIYTYLFAQGYNVSCSTVATPNGTRFVSRGLNAYY